MNHYKIKNVLVTGGAGFIGCNFIAHLLKQDTPAKIINLDALTYASHKSNPVKQCNNHGYQFIEGNICDHKLVDHILRQYDIDTIVHFAAESHVDRSITQPSIFVQTNVMGTFTLLQAAKQYWLDEKNYSSQQCRFHHVSTDEVYGSLAKDDPAFCETTAYAPNSPYAASKAGSDHLVRAFFHTYGLPITISNCSNNYGPHQHNEKLIPTIIASCLAGAEIPVYGDGSNIRDWLFVDDHCRAITTIINCGDIGEVYNIGGNSEQSNIAVVNKICQLLDQLKPKTESYQRQISFIKDRLGHDWRYAINYQKIKQMLGWQPQHTFDQGLKQTVQFYLANHHES